MSLALTHFAVGATLTALATLYLLPSTQYARTLTLCGGIWGMIPDIHWVSPVYAAELKTLHSSVFMNVFWFHETLDVLDPTDSYTVAAAAVGLFVGITLVTDRWGYTIRERATPAMGTDSPIEPLRSLTRLTQIASTVAVALGVSYLGVGVAHPGVGSVQPMYLGIGTALIAGGTLGLAGHLTRADWVTHQVPLTVRRGLLVVGSGGTALVGGTLLAAIVRNGLTATAVGRAGLGALLGLLALLLAGLRVADQDREEPPTARNV
ncbi:hypothetical protein [Halorubrum sp. FL23]|uniref:hypothetical protein n=1 Tax=Halorubrum sp. FL23 TaxID=3458704 RepID=UPI004034C039